MKPAVLHTVFLLELWTLSCFWNHAAGFNTPIRFCSRKSAEIRWRIPVTKAEPLLLVDCDNVAPGTVLIAPEHEYNHFLKSQAVLIYDMSDDGATRGVILERPTAFTVGEMVPGFECFTENKMFTGGDDGGKSVIMIHKHALEGARAIGSGLFVGGVARARFEVSSGALAPTDFKFFFNHVALTSGDLRGMLEHGGWLAVSLSDVEAPVLTLQNDDTGLWSSLRYRAASALTERVR